MVSPGRLGDVILPPLPPLTPCSRLSRPQRRPFTLLSVTPKTNPVKYTSRWSATPSPLVSFRKRISGGAVTKTPPFHGAIEVGKLRSLAKTVDLSALPSPLVSSSRRMVPPGFSSAPRPYG